MSMSIGNKQVVRQIAMLLGIVGLTLVATSAFGAGFDIDQTGAKAKSAIEKVVTWGVIIAGAIGAGVLLIKFVQAWQGHIDWMDLGKFALFYAATGAVVGIATVIFKAFQ